MLDVSSTPLPALNDTCSTAITVAEGTYSASLFGASPDASPVPCGARTFDDVWYAYDNTRSTEVCIAVTVTPAASFIGLSMDG